MATRNDEILDDALAAWRETSKDETLSGAARTSLFNEVRSMGDGSNEAFVPGLTRAWRWAFLGSVPVVALTAVLMVAGNHGKPLGTTPQLSAAKIDGRLVFSLNNGSATHMIYRSTDPQAFDRSAAVKMSRNRYSEDATGGPTLVFYRID
jgi:hypothetical protein